MVSFTFFMLPHGADGSCAFMRQADPEPLRRAAASAQASVRQRAAALLKLLGADDAGSAPRAAQPSPVGNLMGGMDEAAPAAAPQPSTQDLLGAAVSTHTASHWLFSTFSARCFHAGGCLCPGRSHTDSSIWSAASHVWMSDWRLLLASQHYFWGSLAARV